MFTPRTRERAHPGFEYVREIRGILESNPVSSGGFAHCLQKRDIGRATDIMADSRAEPRGRGAKNGFESGLGVQAGQSGNRLFHALAKAPASLRGGGERRAQENDAEIGVHPHRREGGLHSGKNACADR